MKSSIWRLAGVGLLCMSISAQSLAEQPHDPQLPRQGHKGEGPREHGSEGRQGNNQQRPRPQNNQMRPENNQQRPQNNQARPEHNQPRPQKNQPRAQSEIIRGDNSRQFERSGQNQGGQWQNRPLYDPNVQSRPVQQRPSSNLPIQSRPDTVRQTQEPLRGYYEDVPRRYDRDQRWQTGGGGSRSGDYRRSNDYRWPGRPGGHGTGWGPGPQYRPGYVVDRFPDRDYRVPYHGRDYFFSGGYWYSPHGPRYVVIRPPRGIRISYLPDYAREIWIGSALFFLAAGVYYIYEASTQQYVVVDPPQAVSYGYDVIAYPANRQTPEQINQDRYDCYRWAVEQSGFDPAAVTYQPAPAVVQTYRQAQGNCLSSRGYQVTY
jgi:hypothetical protein